jgi:hypothetical protein
MATILKAGNVATGAQITSDATGILEIRTGTGAGTTAITVGTDQAVTMAGRTTNPTTISVGNATPSTSGAGITFPATQSASSNANTLDDYEEGTFTPSFVSSGGGTATYSNAVGRYTKIGRLVYAAMRVTLSNKTGLNAGTVSVGGLPFASNSTNVGRLGTTQADISSITSYALGDSGGTYLGANQTSIFLLDNAFNQVTVADLTNTSSVDLQITYET